MANAAAAAGVEVEAAELGTFMAEGSYQCTCSAAGKFQLRFPRAEDSALDLLDTIVRSHAPRDGKDHHVSFSFAAKGKLQFRSE